MSERNEDSFIFYESFYRAIETVPNAEQRANLYRMIAEYAMYGTEPLPQTESEKIIIIMARPQLEANYKKRVNGRKGAEHGKDGGRPKKNPSGVIEKNPSGSEVKTPNANANGNENANVNDNAAAVETAHGPEDQTLSKTREPLPSVEDIRRYCEEKGHTFDQTAFLEKIAEKAGSGDPVRNWTRYADKWQENESVSHEKPKKRAAWTAAGTQQREYDFDELEARLIGQGQQEVKGWNTAGL